MTSTGSAREVGTRAWFASLFSVLETMTHGRTASARTSRRQRSSAGSLTLPCSPPRPSSSILIVAETVFTHRGLPQRRLAELRRAALEALLSPATEKKQTLCAETASGTIRRTTVRFSWTETNHVVCWRCRGQVFRCGRSVFGCSVVEALYFITSNTMNNANTYDVFTVIPQGDNKKPYWHRVGTALSNRDGSLSVLLNSLPVDGKLQIRERRDDVR